MIDTTGNLLIVCNFMRNWYETKREDLILSAPSKLLQRIASLWSVLEIMQLLPGKGFDHYGCPLSDRKPLYAAFRPNV
jgi:hypothetical protein